MKSNHKNFVYPVGLYTYDKNLIFKYWLDALDL